MNFLLSKWIKAILKRGLQALLAVLAAQNLQSWGVQTDVDAGLVTVEAFVFLEAARGYLKHKLGWKFL